LVPVLSPHFTLLIPDLPGFGQSVVEGENGWAMADYVQWLREFLEAQRVDTLAAVMGHSLGGKLAGFAWLVHSDQELLALPVVQHGLFLISPSGICASLSWKQQAMRWLSSLVPHRLSRQALSDLRRWVYQQWLGEADYYQADPWQEATLKRILAEDIRRQVTHQSQLPLHILWGERDTAVPVWMAYEWLRLSQYGEVLVVPNAGHHVFMDNFTLTKQWFVTYLMSQNSRIEKL
jgi:pimeloyl-ACP methyl ester carboxylesterase